MKVKQALNSFFRSYLDMPKSGPRIVCLGGGTGMPMLLSGLKSYTPYITAVVTMADSGGSTGRLRRLLGVPAVGDLRKCFAALADEEEIMTKLLAYRFKGDRYREDDRDDVLGGHSFGNLFLSALTDITGDFEKALEEASRILKITGRVLPSTSEDINIWAETEDGQKIYGEENIDLGKYNGGRSIVALHLDPEDAPAYKPAVEAILKADMVIAGPGDLYTSLMPNLLVNEIREAIAASPAKKLFIVNTANKPFETPRYKLTDYVGAVQKHAGDLFSVYLTNVNQTMAIPKHLKYTYVRNNITDAEKMGLTIIQADVIDESFPLQHDKRKLAAAVMNLVQS